MDDRSLYETMASGVQIVRWPHRHALPEREVIAFFEARGVSPSRWANAPDSVYGVHDHPYSKTVFCVQGRITFSLPDLSKDVALSAGDRLIIPAGIRHGAIVGGEGVTCIEGAES